MNTHRIRLPLFLAALALPSGGCVSNALVLDFNGRQIEVEEVQQASFPRGLEITSFDGHTMKVNGREAITVNGKELKVNDSSVTHGTSRHVMGTQQKLIIGQDGQFRIVDKQVDSEKSWWAFWR